jgi:hypothetical protein
VCSSSVHSGDSCFLAPPNPNQPSLATTQSPHASVRGPSAPQPLHPSLRDMPLALLHSAACCRNRARTHTYTRICYAGILPRHNVPRLLLNAIYVVWQQVCYSSNINMWGKSLWQKFLICFTLTFFAIWISTLLTWVTIYSARQEGQGSQSAPFKKAQCATLKDAVSTSPKGHPKPYPPQTPPPTRHQPLTTPHSL